MLCPSSSPFSTQQKVQPYKKPFVILGWRLKLLFRLGTSTGSSGAGVPFLIPLTLLDPPSKAGVPNLTLPPFTLPFSMRKCFHPSSSRSKRSAFSFSVRNSRSARRAVS
ncbi:hypothetical protein F4860DRAFT_484312 [Xylaria cubensis]|nr:hypothetical protein F4860DRAFT_484312 [Xylaria cubensis]